MWLSILDKERVKQIRLTAVRFSSRLYLIDTTSFYKLLLRYTVGLLVHTFVYCYNKSICLCSQ